MPRRKEPKTVGTSRHSSESQARLRTSLGFLPNYLLLRASCAKAPDTFLLAELSCIASDGRARLESFSGTF